MFLVFALIATLPLVALSYLAIAETRAALADEVGRSHEDTARAAAAFVGAYVDTARATLVGAAGRGNLTPQDVRAFELQNPSFSSVILAPAGRPLLDAPDIITAATTNGTLVGRLNIGRLLVELQSFAHGNGETILLTDADGQLLLESRAGVPRNWSDVEPVRQALRADAGHLEFTDPDTLAASVAGYAPVPRLGWTVVDEVPTAVAYAALTRLTAVLIVLSGILVGAILLASVILARRIVKPVRELTSAAGAVAGGTLATRIDAQGNDEIAALAQAFNEMAGRVSESLASLRASEGRYRNLAAELESRVEARTSELRAKSDEMESFLYSVSHDLKAPLISIEGYAQGLEEDFGPLLDEEGKRYLERIRKNASLMERLILDILELSRIGRIRETPEDLDLNEILGTIAARVEDRFAAVGGTLAIQPGLPHVRGERNRVEQLFTNLIENALKYRHPARPVAVRVEGERVPEGASIRVVDNGRGIAHGSQEQLFRIFQRLPTPAGMDDPGGTGMGLAIVQRIVDTHRGRIRVESVEGEGSVFTVVLPSP